MQQVSARHGNPCCSPLLLPLPFWRAFFLPFPWSGVQHEIFLRQCPFFPFFCFQTDACRVSNCIDSRQPMSEKGVVFLLSFSNPLGRLPLYCMCIKACASAAAEALARTTVLLLLAASCSCVVVVGAHVWGSATPLNASRARVTLGVGPSIQLHSTLCPRRRRRREEIVEPP